MEGTKLINKANDWKYIFDEEVDEDEWNFKPEGREIDRVAIVENILLGFEQTYLATKSHILSGWNLQDQFRTAVNVVMDSTILKNLANLIR